MTWSVPILDSALGLCALLASGCALGLRQRTAQAMGFLCLGIVMSLIWLRLGSVDVALAEAGLGGGILGALLVWLAVRGPGQPDGSGTSRSGARLRALIGLVTGSTLTVAAAAAWTRAAQELPAWTEPLEAAMPRTGVEHEVTGVLLAFRAYDTLLESAVLLFAAVAVLALGRDRGLGHVRADGSQFSMPASALPWVARWLAPVILLIGLWLLFAGSSDSGGAFQSGAVLSALLILLHTAQVPLTGLVTSLLKPALVLGVLIFTIVGLIGPATGEPWLSWGEQWSFAIILSVEIALTIGIAVALFVVYLGLESPAERGRVR